MAHRTPLPLVLAAGALAALPGCLGAGAGPCDVGFVTTLHLGRTSADGTRVDDEAVARFLDEVVTPAFPGGFTTLRGEERRAGPDAAQPVVRDDVVLLQVVRCNTKEAEAALVRVALAWSQAFGQDTILRTDTRATIYW